jgi:chromosomal replication initiator protein
MKSSALEASPTFVMTPLAGMERTPETVWKACLEIIRDNVNRQSYKTWFEPIKPLSLVEEAEEIKLIVQLPSRFYFEWLEEHYYSLLRKTITKVLGPRARLFYKIVIEKEDPESGFEGATMSLPARTTEEPPPVHRPTPLRQPIAPESPQAAASPAPASTAEPQKAELVVAHPFAIPGIRRIQVDSNLDPDYTFDRFIEGDCNRLARSAALAIAKQPGTTSFNPFLVYGGVGLGKTHLIQAIGNYARQYRTAETILYVSSERFTNEFVQAIQHNRVSEFSMFYRQIDLLIVDDIQFFGGKEKTQEEFFHIFNALHQAGKQIVLSADRPPREIPGIEERLLSRFQWGLTVDVQPPDLETRIAILRRKAEDEGVELKDEVIEFIAHHIKSNIRELEGALIRLVAHSAFHKCEIDLNLAREVLRDLIKESRVTLTVEQIQQIVCEYFRIPPDQVRAKTRKREVVQARQVAMYFCKHFTQHSLKSIGLHFGGRDHSTVIHAIQSVEDQMETDPKFRELIEALQHKISLRSR